MTQSARGLWGYRRNFIGTLEALQKSCWPGAAVRGGGDADDLI